MEISKNDWKLFPEKLGIWQERYMKKLNKEYVQLLTDSEKPASDRFWKLEEKIKHDKKSPGVILEVRKRDMAFDLIRLLREGIISFDDLKDFSIELQEYIKSKVEE